MPIRRYGGKSYDATKNAMLNSTLCMVNPSLLLFSHISVSSLFLNSISAVAAPFISLFNPPISPTVHLHSLPPLWEKGVRCRAADDHIYRCLHRNQRGRKENANTGWRSIRIPTRHFTSHMSTRSATHTHISTHTVSL